MDEVLYMHSLNKRARHLLVTSQRDLNGPETTTRDVFDT